jgi:hypothetical protein
LKRIVDVDDDGPAVLLPASDESGKEPKDKGARHVQNLNSAVAVIGISIPPHYGHYPQPAGAENRRTRGTN